MRQPKFEAASPFLPFGQYITEKVRRRPGAEKFVFWFLAAEDHESMTMTLVTGTGAVSCKFSH